MKKHLRFVALALAVAAAARPAPAQQPAALSLAEALRIAREKNPDLLAARNDVASAQAQREIAVQVPNPTFYWTTSKIPTDATPAATDLGNGLFDRSYDSILALGQLVEVGGKRKSRRLSADHGLAAVRARLLDVDRLVTASVVRAYVGAAVARANTVFVKDSAESFARTADLAAEREAAGEISRAERQQVEIASGRFEADAVSAEAAYANALLSLDAVLGVPPGTGARVLTDDLASLTALTAASPGTATDDTVLEKRPEIAALEAALRKAEADLALQKAGRIPDPTLLAQYEREPPDRRNSVGVGVSIPLPVLNQNAGAVHLAEAAVEAARGDLARGRLRVQGDLLATRRALEAASRRARRLADDLLPMAESVRETVAFSYSEGTASLLELLEATRNANEIRLAATAARGDLVTARADFAAARLLPLTNGENPR